MVNYKMQSVDLKSRKLFLLNSKEVSYCNYSQKFSVLIDVETENIFSNKDEWINFLLNYNCLEIYCVGKLDQMLN